MDNIESKSKGSVIETVVVYLKSLVEMTLFLTFLWLIDKQIELEYGVTTSEVPLIGWWLTFCGMAGAFYIIYKSAIKEGIINEPEVLKRI